jgi:hypothetical protein
LLGKKVGFLTIHGRTKPLAMAQKCYLFRANLGIVICMVRKGTSRGWFAIVVCLSLAVHCDPTPDTGIVLALRVEPTVPEEIDSLQIAWSRGDQANTKYDYSLPQGVTLPGTLLFRTDDPNGDSLQIDVEVSKDGVSKIRKKVRLRFAQEKIKLLRVTMEYACLDIDCPVNQTCQAGECIPIDIDPNSLPEFEDTEQALPPPGTKNCFDRVKCLANAQPVVLDVVNCQFPVPPSSYNVGLQWSGSKIVPIPKDTFGFEEITVGTGKLAPALCKAVSLGKAKLFVASGCQSLAPEQPICVPPATGTGGASGAGGMAGTSGQGGSGGVSGNSGQGGMAGVAGSVAGMSGTGGLSGNAGNAGNAGTGGTNLTNLERDPTFPVGMFPDSDHGICRVGMLDVECADTIGANSRQDGAHRGNHSQLVASNNITYDGMLKLQWAYADQIPMGTMNPDCSSFGQGWGTPSRLELTSLLDLGQMGTVLPSEVTNSVLPGNMFTKTMIQNMGIRNLLVSRYTGISVYQQITQGSPSYGYRCIFGSLPAASQWITIDGETKLDRTYGLMWESGNTIPIATSWQEALDVCYQRNKGGYQDWRVPSYKEAATLLGNNELVPPNIDLTKNDIWTSTVLNDVVNAVFAMSGTLKLGAMQAAPMMNDLNNSRVVACVRGGVFHNRMPDSPTPLCFDGLSPISCESDASLPGLDGHRQTNTPTYVPAPVGTTNQTIIHDVVSGLTWQNQPQNGTSMVVTYEEAQKTCASLILEGTEPWRLPTRDELISLIDYGKSNPALHPLLQTISGKESLWSLDISPQKLGWIVEMGYGNSLLYPTIELANVRCVRGGLPRPKIIKQPNNELLDESMHLRWDQTLVEQPYTVAYQECFKKNSNTNAGWRLPTIKELVYLADEIATPVFPFTFPPGSTGALCSSSVVKDESTLMWCVDSDGQLIQKSPNVPHMYACVSDE